MYAIDYDDYDYEPEPYDTEAVQRTYELGNSVYEVEIVVLTWQLRAGNYSPVASDPDEYYGEYTTSYHIGEVLYYENEESEGEYLDVDKLPKWLEDEIAYEFEE